MSKIDLAAIKQIESASDPNAYNPGSRARGLYQITPVCLEHYNQVNHTHYKEVDLFDPEVNERIARWYFKQIDKMLDCYNIPVDDFFRIAAFNLGIGNVKKWFELVPQETRDYYIKYCRIVEGV